MVIITANKIFLGGTNASTFYRSVSNDHYQDAAKPESVVCTCVSKADLFFPDVQEHQLVLSATGQEYR